MNAIAGASGREQLRLAFKAMGQAIETHLLTRQLDHSRHVAHHACVLAAVREMSKIDMPEVGRVRRSGIARARPRCKLAGGRWSNPSGEVPVGKQRFHRHGRQAGINESARMLLPVKNGRDCATTPGPLRVND
jgi:hypothetical protein